MNVKVMSLLIMAAGALEEVRELIGTDDEDMPTWKRCLDLQFEIEAIIEAQAAGGPEARSTCEHCGGSGLADFNKRETGAS